MHDHLLHTHAADQPFQGHLKSVWQQQTISNLSGISEAGGLWRSLAEPKQQQQSWQRHRHRRCEQHPALQVQQAAFHNSRQDQQAGSVTTPQQAAEVEQPQRPAGTSADPVAVSGVLSPAQNYFKAVEIGVTKAHTPAWKTFSMSLLAGAYVGFGGFLALSIGANCPELAASNPGLQKLVFGAVGLPTGLTMVIICGAELFTSNAAMLPCAWYERKVTQLQVLRNWALAWSGNLAGALGLVGLIAAAGMFGDAAAAAGPIALAEYKCHHTWLAAFTRGILCNWLVCIAVWQANAAHSLGSKFVGVLLPISAFVAIGLEHSVANMFMLPCGMMLGADITASEILTSNLIPVTLGNIVAGTFLVAGSYSIAFGALGKRVQAILDKAP